MATKTLDDRRRALEDSFFERENEKLLSALRAKSEREIQRRALAEVAKLQDEDLLDHLIEVGIRAETWLAIWLVPLVEVAWADREMAEEEREALLNAAAEHGIEADSDARRLLEVWLARRPGPKLREAWTEYIGIVRGNLNDAARETLREQTLEQSRAVARAAGGFLGIGPHVSEAEERVLEELERAF
ncbi:MAG: hypothetical protein JRJ58_00015 [Deltaproteobacteria bacterium]|nr:hypothetical protein [Deltaproteobacteria bacterium]